MRITAPDPRAGTPRRGRRGPPVARAALLLGAALAIAGCGPQGPARYRVHGTITYEGKPVPLGRIVFEPDVLKGNRGPQGFAVVENGLFDTSVKHGKGTSGGPMVVTIDAYEASSPGQAARPLLQKHQEQRELPEGDTELNFDLQAAKGH